MASIEIFPELKGVPSLEQVRERRAAILDTLRTLRDPQARFQWLVDRARTRPMLPDSLRTDGHRVPGCQVRLWWIAEERDGRLWFASDSDAVTLKAITGLLADCYGGETAEGVKADPPRFLEDLGLLRLLAESRRATILRVADSMSSGGTSGGGTSGGGTSSASP